MLVDKVKRIAEKLTYKVSLELDIGTTFQTAKLKWLGFTYLTQSDLEEINKVAESLGFKVTEYYLRNGFKACLDDVRAFEDLCKQFMNIFKDTILTLDKVEIRNSDIKFRCIMPKTFVVPKNLIESLTTIFDRLKNEGFTVGRIDFIEMDGQLGEIILELVADF